MGWLSTNFLRRAAITIDNSAGAGGNVDVEITIPEEWDAFWDEIDSSGDELRITGPDGTTVLNYDLSGFVKATRTGTIQIDGIAVNATAGVHLAWIYWDTVSTAGDGSTAVTITSAVNGYIFLGKPHGRIYAYKPAVPGQTRPRDLTMKGSAEAVYLWVRMDQALARRFDANRGADLYEEVWWTELDVVNSGGSSQSSMFDVQETRFRWHNRQFWIAARIKAGTDGNPYTAVITPRTLIPDGSTTWQTLEHRVGFRVDDVVAST